MPKKSTSRTLSQALIVLSCFVTLILGFTVLLGWQIYLPILKPINPADYTMEYNAAFSMCIASLGVLCAYLHRLILTRIIAVFLIIIALLTFIYDIFGPNWNWSEKPLAHFILLNPNYIGQTRLVAAFCFLLIGIMLWLLAVYKPAQHRVLVFSSWTGIIVAIFSILSLFNYLIPIYNFHTQQWGLSPPLSINTSIGFIFLSIATANLVFYFSHEEKFHFRRYFPIAFAIFIALVSILFWRFLISEKQITNLPFSLSSLLIIKEIGIALLVVTTIYFAQNARNSAKKVKNFFDLTQSVLEMAADGIVTVDLKGKIKGYNKKILKMWKIPITLIEERNHRKLLDYAYSQIIDKDKFLLDVEKLMGNPKISLVSEIKLIDGSIYELRSFPQQLGNKIIGRIYSYHDITHLKQAESKLLYYATHDILTNLPNRFLLLDHIEQAIANANRSGKFLAIFFFDLDRFKLINDSLGHEVGDALLKSVADRLKKTTRNEDTLARLGGDEFVLLVTDLPSTKSAGLILEKYLDLWSKPFVINDYTLYLSCSIGVSLYPRDGEDGNTLLKSADIAMYRSKKHQLPFQFYTQEMQQQIIDRLMIENELRHAIDRNELILYYQPIIDLKLREICATEALIRWDHPTLGLLLPGNFLHIAQDMGIIKDIDNWTLHAACAQNKAWQEQGLLKGRISVNVSESQLRQAHFSEMVAKALADTALEPQYLELELIEDILVEDFSFVVNTLQKLKKIGVAIVIDDFGVGYSNLNYLKHLPLDKLKIDKAFIKDLPRKEDDRIIVLAIIAMARTLKLRVLAEGVEHDQQIKFLYENNCDEVQGYYYSPPIPAYQYEKLINSINERAKKL